MAPNFRRSQNRSDQPLGGRYKIVDKLGEGGFGQTFKAQDLHLPGHPLCVVKQLNPQVEDAEGLQIARRLFDTEANVLYQVGSHPQIPHLLAHFEENNEFYLAQELIDGHSMADEFETVPWDVPKVISFLGDVLDTLAFVHANRVIHRDLKPSNLIRRQQDNRIVVIDFGAVKQAGTQPAGSAIGHTISIGTQGYMPSEQLAGQPHFSSDVYAVGILAIQALTGQPPKQLMPHPQTGELDWHAHVPHIPLELITVLDKMVRYDFRARYISAKEALVALKALPPALVQYISAPGSMTPVAPPVRPSVSPSASSSVSPAAAPNPTELTVPAMSASGPGTDKSAMATDVVSKPAHSASGSTSRKLPAILIGLVILGAGLLIGRACTSAAPNNGDGTVVTQTPAPPIDLTPDTAQTALTTFYEHLSNQSWEQALAQTSGTVAQQFNPDFFRQFQRVSVENLQVQTQTPESIEFLGQNTYTYNDGSIQTEERTFTVQLVDGQPRIVDSAFVRVMKHR